jgi:hypothetical protein
LKKSPDRADAFCLAVYRGRRPAYAYAPAQPREESRAPSRIQRGGRGAMNY